MNKFEMNVNKANELVSDVWKYYTCGARPHQNFLDGWASAKEEYLSELFGGELILKKEVEVEQTYETLKLELERLSVDITRAIEQERWYKDQYSWSLYCELRAIFNEKHLFSNKVHESADFGEKRKLQQGEKLTRTLKKLITNPVKVDALQTAYSKIVNQKTLKGTLCLSIHPLDFLTMSYTSTWSSCFNVFNEGEYRAGALELACSKNTICAYLTSRDLKIEDRVEWNDKKWRTIVTVDPEQCIMSGKNYPYQSEQLTRMVYEWVAELCKDKYGEFDSWEDVKEGDEVDYRVRLEYGYNDFNSGSRFYHIGENKETAKKGMYFISYGKIPCPDCGEENHFAGESITCRNCDGSFCCDCCGEDTNSDSYTIANGDQVCYYCYDEYYRECENCGEAHHYEDMTHSERGDYYCHTCAEKCLVQCERCDEYYVYEDICEKDGSNYCDFCYDRVVEEEEEERKEREQEEA